MRKLYLIAAFACYFTTPYQVEAQMAPAPTTSPFSSDNEDTVSPKTSYPLGRSDLVAQSMATVLRMEGAKRKLCDEFGCLLLSNDSKNYNLVGFYVKMPQMLGTDRWGVNQLDALLPPKYSLLKVKTGDATACALPIRLELKRRGTGERVTAVANGNFCTTPGQTNTISIRVATPSAEVVEQGSSDTNR